MSTIRVLVCFATLSLSFGILAQDFGVDYIVAKTYPSLTPKKALRVKVADSDVDPSDANWHPESPSAYDVKNITKNKSVGVTRVECPIQIIPYVNRAETTPLEPGVTTVLKPPSLHYVLKISQNSSENISATITPEKNTLDGVRDSINSKAAGRLIASVTPDKSPNRLVVTSTDSAGLPFLQLLDGGNDILSGSKNIVRSDGIPTYDVVYLHLDPNAISDGDELQVTLKASSNFTSSIKAKVKGSAAYTLSLNPGYVPNEELNNGKKRNVGQLGVLVDVPFLMQRWSFARTYVSIDNLFSSDAKDKASKLDFLSGVERSLTAKWYIPVHLQSELKGNQTADNLSSITSAGLRTLLPWAMVKPILYNPLFQAPVSPELQFDAQYERRINQDAQSTVNSPRRNVFRAFGQANWKPIRLLPGANHSDTIDLELLGKGWFIPNDRDKFNKRKDRLEGFFEMSLLVPLTKLNFIPGTGLLPTGDAATQRIRIKYSAGANDANGFKHARQLSIGVELIK